MTLRKLRKSSSTTIALNVCFICIQVAASAQNRQDLMLKNLKKRRAQLYARGELAEAKEYSFFPVSFEMPKVRCPSKRAGGAVSSRKRSLHPRVPSSDNSTDVVRTILEKGWATCCLVPPSDCRCPMKPSTNLAHQGDKTLDWGCSRGGNAREVSILSRTISSFHTEARQ